LPGAPKPIGEQPNPALSGPSKPAAFNFEQREID
jgi:hypothetical protein